MSRYLDGAHHPVAASSRCPPSLICGLSDDARHFKAITSTRASSLRSSGFSAASFSMTRCSAWMETSTWSSLGSRVVQPLQPQPGARSVISTRSSWCLPAYRMSS